MKTGGRSKKTLFSFAERLLGPLLRLSLGLVLLWIGAIHLVTPLDEEFGIPIAATMPFPGHLGRQ
ncbi:MAG TPA: hypothetical protein VF026_09495 [Ktedonobacteraceae bacterium]